MGIVNVTPDSFWPGSRAYGDQAIELGLRLANEGAQVLDIGGESTRPGSEYVDAETEWRRIVPVLEGLQDAGCQAQISIDTRKRAVMEAAAQKGATWLNDVSALQDDADLARFAAEAQLTVVLMHRQGHPTTMQNLPQYDNVVTDVKNFLSRRIEAALKAGISQDRILVDPGFGFGKTFDQTIQLFQGLPEIASLGFPVLAGLSRKSFLGRISGTQVEDRLPESVVAALASSQMGVSWIRVHDVLATVNAFHTWDALRPQGGW